MVQAKFYVLGSAVFTKTIMSSLVFLLVLLSTALAAHAAEPIDFYTRTADPILVPLIAFEPAGSKRIPSYQLVLSIVPVRPLQTLAFGLSGDANTRLGIAVDARQQFRWKGGTNLTPVGNSARASLMSVLRFDSHEGYVEIHPRRNSLSITWRMDFH